MFWHLLSLFAADAAASAAATATAMPLLPRPFRRTIFAYLEWQLASQGILLALYPVVGPAHPCSQVPSTGRAL